MLGNQTLVGVVERVPVISMFVRMDWCITALNNAGTPVFHLKIIRGNIFAKRTMLRNLVRRCARFPVSTKFQQLIFGETHKQGPHLESTPTLSLLLR